MRFRPRQDPDLVGLRSPWVFDPVRPLLPRPADARRRRATSRHRHELVEDLPVLLLIAFTYASALVISARNFIDNPLPMLQQAHRHAGIPT